MSTQKRGLSWFVSLAITALLHSPLLGQSIVSTVAGRVRVAPTQPVSAISFALDEPCSVAADGQGNVYFTDFGYNMVFRVAGGMLYPFAGTGSVQSDPVGGKATQTAVTYPFAIATDPSGNVYFTEFKGLTRILKVDSSGIITNVAGGGRNTLEFTTFGDNGPASRADFFEPYGLAVDRNGNAYVSLQSTNRLHKIAPNGILTSLAGIVQTPGFSGDNGPSVNSQINLPEGVAADNRGNVYFVDRNNNRIRKIDTAGIITTVAGNGQAGYSGDGGPAINASLALPSGVAVDSSENVFIADRFNNVIRKVDSAGIIRTIAGDGFHRFNAEQGNALTVSLNQPHSVAVDSSGNVYVVDLLNRRIRKITPDGNMATIAGSGAGHSGGDGGSALNADFDHPSSVRFDSQGAMYVADTLNNRVRKVTPSGIVSTIAGNGTAGYSGDGGDARNAALSAPADIAVDPNGQVYIADYWNSAIRLVDTKGSIRTVAGGQYGYSGDGQPATSASLSFPTGLALGPNGDLFIADRTNNRIRRVDSSGTITTFAGNGSASFGGDGGPAVKASINWPTALSFDTTGTLYLAATQDYRIRQIDRTGTISTVAGNGIGGWSPNEDGVPGPQVSLDGPTGVAADQNSNVFSNGTNQLQRTNAKGILTLLVNQNAEQDWGGLGDGGPGTLASLTSDDIGLNNAGPQLTIGPDGSLFFADSNRIRRATQPSLPAQIGGLGYKYAAFNTNFSFDANGGTRQFPIQNVGTGSMAWTARVDSSPGAHWLSLPVASGNAGDTLTVQASVKGLADGFYRGSVYIDAPNASNSPERIDLVYEVGAPNFGMNGIQSQDTPGPGSLVAGSLTTVTSTLVRGAFKEMAVPESEASWQLGGVSVLINDAYAPIIALANVNGAQQVTFRTPLESAMGPNPARFVVLNGTAAAGLPIPIAPPVAHPVTLSAASVVATAGDGQSTHVNSAFQIPLQAAVRDSLGNPLPGVSVTFAVSNGTATASFPGGTFSAKATTSTTGVAIAPTLTANGAAGTIQISATVAGVATPAMFSLTQTDSSTTIASVTSANGSADIAQNGWIVIKGTNLVPADVPAGGITWSSAPEFGAGRMPTQLGGYPVTVTVNGQPAYIYFLCSAATTSACAMDQINVLTPLDDTQGPVQIVVTNNGKPSPSFTANLRSAAPSFPLVGATQYVVATHSDYSLVGPVSLSAPGYSLTPAKPGETIVIYGFGFGPPGTALQSGVASQTGTLPQLPVFIIGGAPAAVRFAGVVSPGLYQFNVVVPNAVAEGDNSITCTYGGVATPVGDLIAVSH